MIYEENDKILVAGAKRAWVAAYDKHGFLGPETLSLGKSVLLDSLRSSIDDLDESLALQDALRPMRKGKCAVVGGRGTLPFGTRPCFEYTHRYAAHALRVTKDIRIPPGTLLHQALTLDSLSLAGPFSAWRQLQDNGVWTEWQEIAFTTLRWENHPLALHLRRTDGWEVEIGVGYDLWRWKAGLLGEGNTGRYELHLSPGGIRFDRRPTVTRAEISPQPRNYRFNWYLAWDQPGKPAKLGRKRKTRAAVWKANGDLDVAPLAGFSGIIVLDLASLPMPENLLRPDGRPCFCSSSVIKRCKRAIRQLAAIPGSFDLSLKGLTPGRCTTGRHVDRKGEADHWDLTAIIDFTSWVRQILGNDRNLRLADVSDTPALRTLLTLADHDEDSIQYEYVGFSDEDEEEFEDEDMES